MVRGRGVRGNAEPRPGRVFKSAMWNQYVINLNLLLGRHVDHRLGGAVPDQQDGVGGYGFGVHLHHVRYRLFRLRCRLWCRLWCRLRCRLWFGVGRGLLRRIRLGVGIIPCGGACAAEGG